MCEVFMASACGFNNQQISNAFSGNFARDHGQPHISSILVDIIKSKFGDMVYMKTGKKSKFVGLEFDYGWYGNIMCGPKPVTEE